MGHLPGRSLPPLVPGKLGAETPEPSRRGRVHADGHTCQGGEARPPADCRASSVHINPRLRPLTDGNRASSGDGPGNAAPCHPRCLRTGPRTGQCARRPRAHGHLGNGGQAGWGRPAWGTRPCRLASPPHTPPAAPGARPALRPPVLRCGPEPEPAAAAARPRARTQQPASPALSPVPAPRRDRRHTACQQNNGRNRAVVSDVEKARTT